MDLNNYRLTLDHDTDEDILVAVSGGVDSMVLLKLLNDLYLDSSKIKVVHFNHHLREESLAEFEGVKSFANEFQNDFYGIDLDVVSYMKEHNKSMETSARELRYMNFTKLSQDLEVSAVYLGHHGDDLVETVLMRLIKGAKDTGLIGMTKSNVVGNVCYKRPLLDLTKQEVYDLANYFSLDFYEDVSNTDTTITRNFIRSYISPLLKELNSNVHNSFLDFSENKKEEEEYMYAGYSETDFFTVSKLHTESVGAYKEFVLNLAKPLQKRFLKEAIKKIMGDNYSCSKFVIQDILNNMDKTSSDFIEISKGIYIVYEVDKFMLFQKEFIDNLLNTNSKGLLYKAVSTSKLDFENKLFSSSSIGNAVVRKDGVRMSRYFSNNHIPIAFRKYYFEVDCPLIAGEDIKPTTFYDIFGVKF